eukprot:2818585-Rhodomonas_salina.1
MVVESPPPPPPPPPSPAPATAVLRRTRSLSHNMTRADGKVKRESHKEEVKGSKEGAKRGRGSKESKEREGHLLFEKPQRRRQRERGERDSLSGHVHGCAVCQY